MSSDQSNTVVFAIPCKNADRTECIAGAGSKVEEITGFDEGPLRDNWKEELEQRGISVTIGVLHEEALAGLRYFANSGHFVYNARQDSS